MSIKDRKKLSKSNSFPFRFLILVGNLLILLNWTEVSGRMITTRTARLLVRLGESQGMLNVLPHLGGPHVTSKFTPLLLAVGVVTIINSWSNYSVLGT